MADEKPKQGMGLGGSILGSAAGALIGMGVNKWENRQQLKQQEKLQALQMKGMKEMGQFNQALGLDTWEKTGAAAQRRQLEKAGLNVGLMYGQSGSGGGTMGQGAGMPSGGSASTGGQTGMGMQMGLQMQMMQAQIENTKAQTEKTKVDTAKTAGVDTEAVKTGIQNLIASTENTKAKTLLTNYETELKKIESEIAGATINEAITQVFRQTDILVNQMEQGDMANEITGQTKEQVIQQIKTNSTEQALRIATQKAGLIKTGADTAAVNKSIEQMAANMVNMAATRDIKWMEIDQSERERLVKEKLLAVQKQQTDFNTSTAAEIKQWTSIITDIMSSMSGVVKPK